MTSENRTTVGGAGAVGDHRIVAGVDGSAASLRAIEWAARQAELTSATLEVVAAWEWPNSFGWSAIPSGYNPEEDAQKMLESLVTSLHNAHPQIAIAWKVVEGHPAPVLVSASQGADLLVVGNRGHGEFVGMLIGSTSVHCVANAACPVVVFRDNA
jgi:nucleotide-binding universal stress UspA family protein